VLLGLFVAFFQLDFHGDHLREVSFYCCSGARCSWELGERRERCKECQIKADASYLHVGVRQSRIADNRRTAVDNLVNTYHHISAGHARLAAQSWADAAHLLYVLAQATSS
jgi:hypothetical protein